MQKYIDGLKNPRMAEKTFWKLTSASENLIAEMIELVESKERMGLEIISILGSAGLVIDQEEPLQPVLDFEEWLERAYPPAEDGARARAMMAACVEEDLIGHAVWREDGRLKFRRRSIMIRALRPA